MKGYTFYGQLWIVIDVIEMHHGKNGGVSSYSSKVDPYVVAFKFIRQELRDVSARPFVEVSQNDARPLQTFALQNRFIDQAFCLMAALKEIRPQVNVEHMERTALEKDICAKAASTLSSGDTDIVIAMRVQRKSAEHKIAVGITQQLPVLAKG